MGAEVISSMIAAAVALFAVVVGPLITVRVSRNQMLGPMRQAWINSLRDTISEFCARVRLGYDAAYTNTRDDAIHHAQINDRVAHIQATCQLLTKVELLVNPKEIEHRELVRLARIVFDKYHEGELRQLRWRHLSSTRSWC